MKSSLAFAAVLPSLALADYGYQFSNAFSTGPVASNSFIRESTTTLVLPALNSPQNGDLALWAGMGTSNGDLIQALAISAKDGGGACSSTPGQWCVVASTLEGEQKMGTGVGASPGAQVTMHYKYNDGTSQYDQTVSVNGNVVSTLSTSSGHAQGWGTAVECQQAACGSVPAHKYINTKIIMNVADPSYINTLGKTGASGNLVTSDGGKTWTVDTIQINAYRYT